MAAGSIALLLCLAGCGSSSGEAGETLRAYYDAVQQQNFDRLYCLMSGASEAAELGATDRERRAGFERWARAHYESYEMGRDAGRVELDEQGLMLVKLFSLGRGTFVTDEQTTSAGPDTIVVETRIRFGYAHIDLSRFSPGTTLYVCGAPVGRVHPVRIPAGSGEVSVDVLDSVIVEWTLVRTPATSACPAGWTVAAGSPDDDTAETVEVTWVF